MIGYARIRVRFAGLLGSCPVVGAIGVPIAVSLRAVRPGTRAVGLLLRLIFWPPPWSVYARTAVRARMAMQLLSYHRGFLVSFCYGVTNGAWQFAGYCSTEVDALFGSQSNAGYVSAA